MKCSTGRGIFVSIAPLFDHALAERRNPPGRRQLADMAKTARRAIAATFTQFWLRLAGACLASCLTVDTTDRDSRAQLCAHVLIAPDVDAPLAMCSEAGVLESATPAAVALLRRLGVLEHVPSPLPSALWASLESVVAGDSIEWPPPAAKGYLLGCTRYVVQRAGFLLLMREVSDKHAALSDALNRRRLESTGRLVASVAHDMRSSVASIVYSADFLETHGPEVRHDTLRDAVREICDASRRLQLTVDGMLDYAQLGPAISVPVSLREVLNRAQGMLRRFYRSGLHRLRVELGPDDEWLRGNPVVIEQIFVNLLLMMADHADAPRVVTVSSRGGAAGQGTHVAICVSDDGPKTHLTDVARADLDAPERSSIALSVSDARAAARSQGGELELEETPNGFRFSLLIPRSEGPR